MLKNNFFIYGGRILIQAVGEVLYFPIWWYSAGLFTCARRLLKFWLDQEKLLGVGVWIKNIFVPMYGQSDFAGRVISFLMRCFQIIVRSIVLFFFLILVLIVFLIWIFLPLILILATQAQLAALL